MKVFEVIPPRVNTELGDEDEEGIPPGEVADAVIKALANDQFNITVGESAGLVQSARSDFDHAFLDINQW